VIECRLGVVSVDRYFGVIRRMLKLVAVIFDY